MLPHSIGSCMGGCVGIAPQPRIRTQANSSSVAGGALDADTRVERRNQSPARRTTRGTSTPHLPNRRTTRLRQKPIAFCRGFQIAPPP